MTSSFVPGSDLTLAAEFARHLLYKHQHSMGDFGGSADYCNLWALLQSALGESDIDPQVSLDEIRKIARKAIKP